MELVTQISCNKSNVEETMFTVYLILMHLVAFHFLRKFFLQIALLLVILVSVQVRCILINITVESKHNSKSN
jgi:hypothetical protein